MSGYDNDWEPPPLCDDCQEPLSGPAREHGQEGFGHYGRCCACYDAAMGAPADVVERRRNRDRPSLSAPAEKWREEK